MSPIHYDHCHVLHNLSLHASRVCPLVSMYRFRAIYAAVRSHRPRGDGNATVTGRVASGRECTSAEIRSRPRPATRHDLIVLPLRAHHNHNSPLTFPYFLSARSIVVIKRTSLENPPAHGILRFLALCIRRRYIDLIVLAHHSHKAHYTTGRAVPAPR
ncbi:uncharacterized protein SCHCODRAFT_02253768 [Schizophyllum commune H4-8]|uniref:uncharacterized protein n=1 Tax=Schizophyllum commune (strain H4-8 / FGSC 9210) TaxID=578458 RepID=UPI00215E06F6|nr:uncharacterized protein SCHCODRAFT_02253768 [Schizophyllum commune H4-8]KAI5893457.1 hypothetical protein SCHCODRAFT_02253768 [Schizophyllum commune H4-8]